MNAPETLLYGDETRTLMTTENGQASETKLLRPLVGCKLHDETGQKYKNRNIIN